MKSSHTIFFVALLSLATVLTGCGQKLPPGMPKLYKTSITVTDNGDPVEDVFVSFYNADGSIPKWTTGGVTNEKGFLQVKTYGQYDGAPAGEHKIVLSKLIREGAPEAPDMTASEKEIADYERIMESIPATEKLPKILTSAKSTPLTLIVEKKGVSENFDISQYK